MRGGERRSFAGFVATQFAGAANDNVLRTFIALQATSGMWRETAGPGAAGVITILFTVPFLILSGFAGQFADRYSKRTMIVGLKAVEVAVMALACVALVVGNYWAMLGVLLLMCTQSAFFGPAKYGAIPEIVSESRLSRANGTVNMTTNLAVIAGMIAGGHLSHGYAGGVGGIGVALLAIAVAGTVVATTIRALPPSDPTLRIRPWLVRPIVASFREMARDRALLRIAFSWGYFYFVAAIVISAFPDYGAALFGGGDATSHHAEIAYLNVALMVGIAVSSFAAGRVSGDRIRSSIVPPGLVCFSLVLVAFAVVPRSYGAALAMFFALGGCAGFYIVPLQALLQQRTGEERRGRLLGTTNFLSFAFLALGGAVYVALVGSGASVEFVFSAVGVLSLGWVAVVVRWRRAGFLEER